jgi:sRNA-binding carbon storage regulator CsrA
VIEDGRIVLTITHIDWDSVTVGIEADRSITVHRLEVQREIERKRKGAVNASCE